MTIDWNQIQEKWQKKWMKAEIGKAKLQDKKEKFMMVFAYPGISGFLHVGHMRGYSYTDAICRFHRLNGKEVLFPVGTHASGNQAISFAKKVINKDEKWINYLLRNGCSKEQLKKLVTPEAIVEYFNNVYLNDYWKKFGFLCDFDRFTSTINPDYEKFIQWQFKKLYQNNLLVQKPYYATACVNCGPVAVDQSETDISKGGNAEKVEYTLLKFKIDDEYLVAATLRPETVYGQTNLWINPNGEYVKVKIGQEKWVMSLNAAQKLEYQTDGILIEDKIDPKEYIGKFVVAPGINRKIIVLPALFVDTNVGSGIVTSVPSHAPHDWIGLEHVKKNYKELGLSDDVKNINPIPMIKLEGWGDNPAQEAIAKYNIKSWKENDKLEEAKKELYKAEFHSGVLLDNCGEYKGKKVEVAKELVKEKLIELGDATIFRALSEEVICRCGGEVVIKKIDDQWFIKYSDQELTEKSKEYSKEMNILPKEYKEHLPSVLDWFLDRACVRLGNWLGSKFPFDEKWTVEPISDSTLYPAYYIVSKFVNNGSLNVEDLTEEFFDYVFLGKGEGKDKWKEVREEFDYFYPLDMNLGGKEHKTVHFPVFLMNHVAIMPNKKPKGILVNSWVTGKGSKISKSKGGAEPIPNVIKKYGVDAMRLYYAHSGSPYVDIVWDETRVYSYKTALEKIYNFIKSLDVKGKKKSIDDWLISRLNQYIKDVTKAVNEFELRDLVSIVYFTMYDDLQWYIRRGGSSKEIIDEFLEKWIILMNPVTPHLSEELNLNDKLVSISAWPKVDESKISLRSQANEELIRYSMKGIRDVLKLAKLENVKKCTLFVAEPWIYDLFTILTEEIKVSRNIGEIMKKVLENEGMKIYGKQVSKIIGSVLKDTSKLPLLVTSQEEEKNVLDESVYFLRKEFDCEIEIVLGQDSLHPKAKSAWPGRVGILVE